MGWGAGQEGFVFPHLWRRWASPWGSLRTSMGLFLHFLFRFSIYVHNFLPITRSFDDCSLIVSLEIRYYSSLTLYVIFKLVSAILVSLPFHYILKSASKYLPKILVGFWLGLYGWDLSGVIWCQTDILTKFHHSPKEHSAPFHLSECSLHIFIRLELLSFFGAIINDALYVF